MVIYATAEGACHSCALKADCTATSRRYVRRHEHDEALQRMADRATPEAMRRRRCTAQHPVAGAEMPDFRAPAVPDAGTGGCELGLEPDAGNEGTGRGRTGSESGSGLKNNKPEKGNGPFGAFRSSCSQPEF